MNEVDVRGFSCPIPVVKTKKAMDDSPGDVLTVLVETEEGRQTIPADTVVMAVGAVSVDDLARQVSRDGTQLIVIGDAKQPRRIDDAILEGFQAALEV